MIYMNLFWKTWWFLLIKSIIYYICICIETRGKLLLAKIFSHRSLFTKFDSLVKRTYHTVIIIDPREKNKRPSDQQEILVVNMHITPIYLASFAIEISKHTYFLSLFYLITLPHSFPLLTHYIP